MRRYLALLGVAALVAALGGAPARAAADQAEIAFWRAVQFTLNPDELQAYLDAYPNGAFAALARIRLSELRAKAAPGGTPPGPPLPMPRQTAAPLPSIPGVSIQAAGARFYEGDPVPISVDATGLRQGTNFRVTVVPAGTPDQIDNVAAFVANSQVVAAARRSYITVKSPPGRDEARLYYVPQFATRFVLAARASFTVETGFGPASPVILDADARGQFHTDVVIGGARLTDMLIDTGAGAVYLSANDAAKAGIAPKDADYTQNIHTAAGDAKAALVVLPDVAIKSIHIRNVTALVAQPGITDDSLIGMTFIGRLSGFSLMNNRLTLVP